MTTIRDVAKLANVSTATVSRIINGKGEASPETIKRVNKVIKEVGYRPNSLAKSLSKRDSNLIALIIPTLNNPFFPELVQAIEAAASKYGYSLYLCNSEDQRLKVEYYLDSIVDHYACGAIINSLHVNEEDLKRLEERGIPTITIDRTQFSHPYSAVGVNHKDGGYQAVTHLVKNNNCKKIVFLSGPDGEKSSLDRLEGYREALKENKITDFEKIVYGNFETISGYEAINELIKKGCTFDAIFSSNDAMAFGAIRACIDADLQVPEEVKIIGYDNVLLSSYFYPKLTTVSQHKSRIGELTIKELDRLINQPNSKPRKYNISPDLIVRESSNNRSVKNE
ncbi:LacI family transcriptional regulator [Enterococcus faecium]|uniref:LacI family DNA-binding transcriptional regulator n=1 Tax=Enterococcus faecium TaxID=1352 RepID=UPI0001CEB76C|nr:LacI family DNA-binding transcriptional regulator [Enterococcus faecium]EFF28338.1 transcriptional regulator [Enterococcus faecium U0317]ELB74735.1 hypothetical protein OM7_05603 [Enterococcus faecium EnGen0046]ELB80687.1 hypothetical protein OMA_05345 [Enterococcus faecium EnGen0045]MBT1032763.1 LacI family transcriptional regulator [Enterococcus faecium]MCZ1374541.1 LacI family transcriptional regulator [Enterococcus faecium]